MPRAGDKINPAALISRGNVYCFLFITLSGGLYGAGQCLVYLNGTALPDLCNSLSCRPVMEVGRNVKLPVNVCVLHRCYPTSQAKQDGWGSVLPPQNIRFSFAATRDWEGEKKKMNEKGFLEASNCSGDKLWSGSRQTAVLFYTSCCMGSVARESWQSVLWSPGGVETLSVS